MNSARIILLAVVIISFCRCRKEYNPPVISSPNSYLVVEGVLAMGADSTIIHLTRTFKLSDTAHVISEKLARLQVEKDDNTIYPFTEASNGYYKSPSLNLQENSKYRLRIKTSGGKEYLSDYVTPKRTPPIDSVGWRYNDEGVNIYVNAHDPANATRYYRWDFDETTEIHSMFVSRVKIVFGGAIVPRVFPDEDISVCWKHGISPNILIGSSVQLQSDIITEAPLILIDKNSEKLAIRYSMLVRQYAIDRDAYSFFEQMKKNTENIGTFFDPQPSEITGNIHCLTVPGETVIGYVTASSIEQKRIFISHDQVPGWNFNMNCDNLVLTSAALLAQYLQGWDLYDQDPSGYYLASPFCVDCTTRDGVTQKPSYW